MKGKCQLHTSSFATYNCLKLFKRKISRIFLCVLARTAQIFHNVPFLQHQSVLNKLLIFPGKNKLESILQRFLQNTQAEIEKHWTPFLK